MLKTRESCRPWSLSASFHRCSNPTTSINLQEKGCGFGLLGENCVEGPTIQTLPHSHQCNHAGGTCCSWQPLAGTIVLGVSPLSLKVTHSLWFNYSSRCLRGPAGSTTVMMSSPDSPSPRPRCNNSPPLEVGPLLRDGGGRLIAFVAWRFCDISLWLWSLVFMMGRGGGRTYVVSMFSGKGTPRSRRALWFCVLRVVM